ncbi:unnamed protein product [Darwinula stevensoni]|uniref:Vacuolar protein sorting-associated protein 53 homolog n=1 Tax=Darwinula stevensoni TaxID=69355 RepID=A0A7R9A7D9_9CRUS|nr:unnamed protein product [Darwinula stevensoni]CAG0892895.1 unnamed protein product [Darwinula stevensoni]
MATIEEEDCLEDENPQTCVTLPPEVQDAIHQVFGTSDPFDRSDFDPVEYINSIFPTEQSLSNIDDVISKMHNRIATIDQDIRKVLHSQTNAGELIGAYFGGSLELSKGDDAEKYIIQRYAIPPSEKNYRTKLKSEVPMEFPHVGKRALAEAEIAIINLYKEVREIKGKSEESEKMVREITRDIRTLDIAKRNLMSSITTLNHFHMLMEGVDQLQILTEKHQYREISTLLQGVVNVLEHFKPFMDIPQVRQLAEQVKEIQSQLEKLIWQDFREVFGSGGPKSLSHAPSQRIAEACLVLSVLDARVRRDILKWFIGKELEEYQHLFQENQDAAWLDKIDKRFTWLKRHLMEFEDRFGRVFPPDWEVSERIGVEFCEITRTQLSRSMQARQHEIEVKLLLYAIQKTVDFEVLLSRRFSGITLQPRVSTGKDGGSDGVAQKAMAEKPPSLNPFEEDMSSDSDAEAVAAKSLQTGPVNSVRLLLPFQGLISGCFETHLSIYVESQDRNLTDLIGKFQEDAKQLLHQSGPGKTIQEGSVIGSSADLFMFYKKCLVQLSGLTTGPPLVALANVFQKHLREYAFRVLQHSLPGRSPTSGSLSNMPNIKELRDFTTAGIIQNFSNLLKEGEIPKFTNDELCHICRVLTTSEYCLETTKQLESKLRDKVSSELAPQINLSKEQDAFHSVMSQCVNLLVQDLEGACDPALSTITKISWVNVESVGDQSSYVTAIISHIHQTVPLLRDNLDSAREYFTQFCMRFTNNFIPKLQQTLYKCKGISTVGAEQLLLDMHMLKNALVGMPSAGSKVIREPPASFKKTVVNGMNHIEIMLKVVMSPMDPPTSFLEQYLNLLPDSDLTEFQKILEMKGIRRNEQSHLIESYQNKASKMSGTMQVNHTGGRIPALNSHLGTDRQPSRIRKLEKLIKKHL